MMRVCGSRLWLWCTLAMELLPIALPSVEIAPAKFHARFTATWRRYRYRILNRMSPPALDQGRVWHVKKPLDADAMHAA